MPLSKPSPRNQIHTRMIQAQGFQRDDGLWDIESRLVDTKSYSFENSDRGGMINSGEAIHDISIRLTINDELTVQCAESVIDSGPYTMCGDITSSFNALEGLSIKPGWRKAVIERLGGIKGCTHLVDMLLGVISVTAWQTVSPARQKRNSPTKDSRPVLLNSCHALSAASPIVKREWPDFYDPGD